MAGGTPPQQRNRLSRTRVARLARWRLPRAAWVYLLAAAGLLAVSELLWMWHSWPVREILNAERAVWGPTV